MAQVILTFEYFVKTDGLFEMTYGLDFTVFTPTYNRKQTLLRVYDSLRAQNYKSFEWLIVDDGSTDGTDRMVEEWQREEAFPIRYFYQKNGGKHRAYNRGVLEAEGHLFLCLDSDDSCVPETLKRFKEYWDSISVEEKTGFSGVAVHCMDRSGRRIGTRFPEDYMDLKPIEMYSRYRIRGEKWGLHRTDLLKKFPFPEIEGETFIPEGLVWNRIGSKYKVRYVNRSLRIYWYSPKGLGAFSRRNRIMNPRGARLYYMEALRLPFPRIVRTKNIVNYIAFSLHAGIGLSQLINESGSVFLTTALLPSGYFLYKHDLWRYQRHCFLKRAC